MPQSSLESFQPDLLLCRLCDAVPTGLDLDNGYDHYESLAELQKSASGDKYCRLCQMMWESIVQVHQKQRFHLGTHPILSETWPVRLYGLPNPAGEGAWRGYDALELRSGDRAKCEDRTWVTAKTKARTEYPVVSRLYLHKGDWVCPLLYTTVCLDDKSPTGFGIATRWLESCTNHHMHPDIKPGFPDLPTRVIDVDPTSPMIKLAVKGQRLHERAPYTALSYCWGKSKATITTPDNLHRHTHVGMDYQSLPRAIQDAITVTRNLSIRYLWVDALCILQGSVPDAVRDWLTESSKMSQIYGDATLAIIAADSQDCQDEFLLSRQLVVSEARQSRDGIPGRNVLSAYRAGMVPGYVNRKANTWSTRAWTLQEVALSHRALIYTNEQVYWKCGAHGLVSSDGHLSVLPRIDALQEAHLRNDWTRVVIEYSRRFMTNPADKLPALSGLARLHCDANGLAYAAGLCRENIKTELLWRTEHSEKLSPKRPSVWRAPSWSWASIDGPIDYDMSDMHAGTQGGGDGDMQVNQIHLEYLNSHDSYGRVTSGWLSLRGRLRSATSLVLDQYHSAGDVYDGKKMLGRAYADEKRQWPEFEEVEGPLWLLLVTGATGLLLEPHAGAPAQEFKRIGAFFLSRFGRNEVPTWDVMDIKLL